MIRAKHEDFRIGPFVSLWLGDFNSEEELDDYLSEEFKHDFGFEIYPPAGPEAYVCEEGPQSIRGLLEGFSRWQLFIEAATEGANFKGWSTATTAVVFYNFKYQAKFIHPNSSNSLAFIGTFAY